MREPVFCKCEKGTDQLCGNRAADQRLCFHFIASTISLLPKSKLLSLYQSSIVSLVCVRPGGKTPKTDFCHDTAQFILYLGLMLYVHGQQLRSCRDCQLSYQHCSWASLPEAGNQYLAHILLPLTDNCSS